MQEKVSTYSQKHMMLEIQRIINKQLYDDNSITKDMFETVNNSLLRKILTQEQKVC